MRILFAAVSAFLIISCSGGEAPEKAAETKPVQVKTVQVTGEMVQGSRMFSATVTSDQTVTMTPKVTGYIEEIHVSPSDRVKKGQLLLEIKSGELEEKYRFAKSAVEEAENGLAQAQVGLEMAESKKKQAESEYNLAKKTYERYKNLIEENSVSKQEFDQVEAKYKLAREALNIAEQNVRLNNKKVQQLKLKKAQAESSLGEVSTYLSYTKMKAPFDGVVLEKYTDTGNLASPGKPLLKVGNNEMIVVSYVPESLVSSVNVSDEVNVYAESADLAYTAKVLEVSPDIDEATRTFKVKLSGHEELVSGMYARADFQSGDASKVLTVPAEALVQRGQLSILFINDGGRAQMRIVKPGRTINGRVEILSGLNIGDELVVENADVLKSGDNLEIQ